MVGVKELTIKRTKMRRSHHVEIKVRGVFKSFLVGKRRVKVLKNISVTFYKGELAIIFGPSGCGKSTLLHTMLGLEEPDRGKVFLKGKSLYYLDEDGRSVWRRLHVGIVFQQSNWVKSLNVLENVGYPLYLTDLSQEEIDKRAREVLVMVGMEKMEKKRPMDLSGGEQQRVSLARALIIDPDIIVADEPTGNLDSKSSQELIKLLMKLNQEMRKTIVMVTHDASFLPLANRRVSMKDGKIVGDEHE